MHGNASPLEAQHKRIGTELLPLDSIRKLDGVPCCAILLSAWLINMWQVKKVQLLQLKLQVNTLQVFPNIQYKK